MESPEKRVKLPIHSSATSEHGFLGRDGERLQRVNEVPNEY